MYFACSWSAGVNTCTSACSIVHKVSFNYINQGSLYIRETLGQMEVGSLSEESLQNHRGSDEKQRAAGCLTFCKAKSSILSDRRPRRDSENPKDSLVGRRLGLSGMDTGFHKQAVLTPGHKGLCRFLHGLVQDTASYSSTSPSE